MIDLVTAARNALKTPGWTVGIDGPVGKGVASVVELVAVRLQTSQGGLERALAKMFCLCGFDYIWRHVWSVPLEIVLLPAEFGADFAAFS